MSGSILSKLFKNNPSLPDKTVEEVLLEQKQKQAQDEQAKKRFLSDMSAIESSSGKDTNHDILQKGIHAGQRAVGQYGLMPKTITEMVNRMKIKSEVPKEIRLMQESGLSEQEIADKIAQDPDLEAQIADALYGHVKNRFAGDEEKMNYSWEHGHNLNPDSLNNALVESHPRTEKFKRLRQKLIKK